MATKYYKDAKGTVVSVTDGQKWRYGDNTFTGNPGDAKLAVLGLTPYTPPPPPTEEEIQAAKRPELKAYENAFLDLCKALGFQGKAGTAEIQAVLEPMPDSVAALKLAVKLLAIKDGIREYGGNWAGIPNVKHQV